MAEEFEQLPQSLQKISYTLVHNRNSRTAFICGVIIAMALTSSSSLILSTPTTSTSSDSTSATTQKDNSFLISTKQALFMKNLSILDAANHNNSDKIWKLVVKEDKSGNCSGCLKNIVTSIDINEIMKDAEDMSLLNNETSEVLHSLNLKLQALNHTLSQIRLKRSVSDFPEVLLTETTSFSPVFISPFQCFHPEYIVFTWILCLIALATALKLYYLIKLFLAVVMLAVYTVLILVPYYDVFHVDEGSGK